MGSFDPPDAEISRRRELLFSRTLRSTDTDVVGALLLLRGTIVKRRSVVGIPSARTGAVEAKTRARAQRLEVVKYLPLRVTADLLLPTFGPQARSKN